MTEASLRFVVSDGTDDAMLLWLYQFAPWEGLLDRWGHWFARYSWGGAVDETLHLADRDLYTTGKESKNGKRYRVTFTVSGHGPGWSPPPPSAWVATDITQDPMTDDQTASVFLTAEEGVSPTGEPYELVNRCEGDEVISLRIDWHQFVDTGRHEVQTRVGEDKPVTASWAPSTDYESTFYSGMRVLSYVEDMFGATSLIARTTPFGGNPTTAVFAIGGLRESIANVQEACRVDW